MKHALPTRTDRRGPARNRWSFRALACGLMVSLVAGACSGSQSYVQEDNYEAQAAEESGYSYDSSDSPAPVAERAPSTAEVSRSEPMAKKAYSAPQARKSYSPPRQAPAKTSSSGPSGGQAQQQKAYQQAPEREREPLVVYFGFLKLRVRRQIEAVDTITKLAQAAGGYVQSLSGSVVVVRVPAADFEGTMAKFGSVGEILDRRVQALDVTRQYTDLGARLAVATEARQRLLELLKTVRDVEQRLQILEEVKRLTEQIESLESTLATIRNLTDFFTITIELQPVVPQTATVLHRSPFDWVRGLQPHLVTQRDGKGQIRMDMPKGFVLFEDDKVFRAQAADTAMLRAAKVKNEPRGTAEFWADALVYEMEGRDEELVDKARIGGLEVRVWRNKDVRPRYYLVAVQPAGEDVFVIEVFFPSEASWKEHRDGVMRALGTFGVQ